MKSTICEMVTVKGKQYRIWGDFYKRGTMAKNLETGEEKQISFSGYINNDLTIRKSIKQAFSLDSFKK